MSHKYRYVSAVLLLGAGLLVGIIAATTALSAAPTIAAEPSQNPSADIAQLKASYKQAIEQITDLQQQLSWLSRTSTPVGTVGAFAGQWPPKKGSGGTWTELDLGWMLCDGRSLDNITHAELIAVLGTAKLPDNSGVFLRGNDARMDGSLAGRDPDGGRALGAVQNWASAMPRNAFTTGGAGQFSFDDRLITGPTIDDGKMPRWPLIWGNSHNTPALRDFQSPSLNHRSVSQPNHTHTIAGGDSETRPINAAVNWIITFK